MRALAFWIAVWCVALAMIVPTVSCTPKPSPDELSRLEEARLAAESAERKLAELRKEREELEKLLQEKQTELKRLEQEREELLKKNEKQAP